MRRIAVVVLAVVPMLAPVAALADEAPAPERGYGRKQVEELAVAFSQWWIPIPMSVNPSNPVDDPALNNCAIGQRGDTWFLQASLPPEGDLYCTLPEGKTILAPVFMPELNELEAPGMSVDEMRAMLAEWVDACEGLVMTVDGTPVKKLERAQPEPFELTLPAGNALGFYGVDYQGVLYPVVTDGLFAMIAPLEPGEHLVHLSGYVELFDVTLDLRWHLTIVEK